MRHSSPFVLLLVAAHAGRAWARGGGELTDKSCAATGGTAACASWCDSNYLQHHCPDCQCAGCNWCAASKVGSCEPLPGSDDVNVQQCQPFCEEKDKKHQ